MATEFIRIVVTDQGTRRVTGNIQRVGAAASRTSASVNLLRKALLLLGGLAVVRSLVNFVDTFTNIQNRLKLVTGGMQELTAVTQELFQVSKRTRADFEATAQVYARTALATKDLGISQEETLQFTEALNQAVILSGASAQEANAGLRQLSQGLASNRLSGDELRSVLEQLPLVADVIAESMQVTRGELRKMGEQGLITADIVLKAFREARVELAEKFAETIPTIGQPCGQFGRVGQIDLGGHSLSWNQLRAGCRSTGNLSNQSFRIGDRSESTRSPRNCDNRRFRCVDRFSRRYHDHEGQRDDAQ